jgi:hypothetical protein
MENFKNRDRKCLTLTGSILKTASHIIAPSPPIKKSQITHKRQLDFYLKAVIIVPAFPKDGRLICFVITEIFYSNLLYPDI